MKTTDPAATSRMRGTGREQALHEDRAPELAIAANAIVLSLLQTLLDKNLLSNTDVRALLMRAAGQLEPHDYGAPAKGAIGIILDDVLPLFPEPGGD